MDKWKATGLPMNTTSSVANVIANLAADPSQKGSCYMVRTPIHVVRGATRCRLAYCFVHETCGPIIREMEHTRKSTLNDWLGEDAAQLMGAASNFFAEMGGYPLPNLKAME
jgi:hypothetical protein